MVWCGFRATLMLLLFKPRLIGSVVHLTYGTTQKLLTPCGAAATDWFA